MKTHVHKDKIATHCHLPLLQRWGKNNRGWVGFQKSNVIFRVGHGKCLCPLTRWVGRKKAKNMLT